MCSGPSIFSSEWFLNFKECILAELFSCMCNQFEISGFDLVVKYKKVFTQNLEKKVFIF